MNDSSERLFAAIPVPVPVAAALVPLQPAPGDGVRLTRPDNMHLTLHFMGSRDVDPVREALRSVRAQAFDVRLACTGRFALRGRKTVLWVGVDPVPRLLALHDAVGSALETTGFTAETRPWQPHITLARLGPRASRGIVEQHDGQSPAKSAGSLACRSFALFSSQTLPEGARYRLLESYPLEGVD